MWNHYKEIRFIMDNPEEGERIREKHLNRILKFACDNTVFYSNVRSNNLKDFPIINKQTILSQYKDFLVPYESIPGQVGKIHIQHTSGSTGIPFEIPQDTNCRTRRIATIKAENEVIDFHSFEPLVTIRSVKHHYSHSQKILFIDKENIYICDNNDLTDCKLNDIYNTINNSKARVVRGYMTSLTLLADFVIRNNLRFHNRPTFISVGELLNKKLINQIHTTLGCNIISQYANEESGVFGHSPINEDGRTIVLNRANCYVEILKFGSDQPCEEGELGRIVVTKALPLIRYDTGDVACVGERTAQGSILSIKNLIGRRTDLIYRTDGTIIDLFNSLTIYHNTTIKRWQFIQTAEKDYQLLLSVKPEFQSTDLCNFKTTLKELLGEDANILIKLTEITLLPSGKHRCVLNEWKKQ